MEVVPLSYRTYGTVPLWILVFCALFAGEARGQDWRLSAGYNWQFYSIDYTANSAYSGTIPVTYKGNLEIELERYLLYRLYLAGRINYQLHNRQPFLGGGPVDFQHAGAGAVIGLQWEQWGIFGGVRQGRLWDLEFLGESPDGSPVMIPDRESGGRWTTAYMGGIKYYLLNFIRLEASLSINDNYPVAARPSAGTGNTPALRTANINPYTFKAGITISIPWNSKKRLERINDPGNLPPLVTTRNVNFDSPMKRATLVTSPFGPRGRGSTHEGVDLDAERNDDIVAAEAGVVIKAGKGTGYGKMVKIRHGGGYVTLYAHLNKIRAKEGEKVRKGEVIGKAGNTGQSRGIHLHFEILQNNRPLDPQQYIRF